MEYLDPNCIIAIRQGKGSALNNHVDYQDTFPPTDGPKYVSSFNVVGTRVIYFWDLISVVVPSPSIGIIFNPTTMNHGVKGMESYSIGIFPRHCNVEAEGGRDIPSMNIYIFIMFL